MSNDLTQCLLFVVHDSTVQRSTNPRNTSTRKLRSTDAAAPRDAKAFVLFPEAFGRNRPEVLQHFQKKDIHLLTNQNVSSLLQKNTKLEIIELLMDDKPLGSVDPVCAVTTCTNREFIGLLFHGSVSCGENEHSATNVRPAVDETNLQLIEHLLVRKADIFCKLKGESLLHVAARRGPKALVSLVLKHGADIDVRRYDKATPLHVAAASGLLSVVQLLLERGAKLEVETKWGLTPLQLSAKNGHAATVRLLISRGAAFDRKNSQKQTALSIAAREGHLEVAELLLMCSAQLGDAFINAGVSGCTEMVDLLLKYGARVSCRNEFGNSVLSRRYRKLRSAYMLKYLLENCFINARSLQKTGIFEEARNDTFFFYSNDNRDILAPHLVKIMALNLNRTIDEVDTSSFWVNSYAPPDPIFKAQCEQEVACLKAETIGDTDLTFFELLTSTPEKVARFLRGTFVAKTAEPDGLQERFPIYGGILAHHFRKGQEKREVLDKGMELAGALFPSYKNLPHELKDKIINYLSSTDLLLFVKVCGRPGILH